MSRSRVRKRRGTDRTRRWGRALGRAVQLLGIFAAAAWDHYRRGRSSRSCDRATGSAWLTHWSRAALRVVGVSVDASGRPPEQGLLVANHLGYLDVLVLASLRPVTFVAKSEVARWLLFGAFARWAGTLFLEREQRGALPDAVEAVAQRLAAGQVVVVFPEGTSTDGAAVQPFHPPLFMAATCPPRPVTPARLDYRAVDGNVARDVCFWGDMFLLPHLWRLLQVRSVRAQVCFAETPLLSANRKWLARASRDCILALEAGKVPGLGGTESPEHRVVGALVAEKVGVRSDLGARV